MNDAEFNRQLVHSCSWWRQPRGWELDDPDLREIRDSRLDYEPAVLKDIVPDGLYVLRGPRRVGKSVEVKRAIAGLIHGGVQPRQIIHFACDGLRPRELRQVARVGRDQATAGIDGPRYWFLDEITAVQGWPSEIKWLRDNTAMRQDCVVLDRLLLAGPRRGPQRAGRPSRRRRAIGPVAAADVVSFILWATAPRRSPSASGLTCKGLSRWRARGGRV